MVVGVMQQRAEACSCVSEPVLTNDKTVPLNVRIPILGLLETNAFELRDTNGVLIPTTTEAVPGGLFLVPMAPLQPSTDYAISPVVSRSSVQRFQTGDAADEIAPLVAPQLGSFTRNVVNSSCGKGEVFAVTVPDFVNEPSVHEVFIGPTTKSIDTSHPVLFVPAAGTLFIGDAVACQATLKTSAMADLAIAIRTRDFAGNVSPLSEPIQLKGGGTGCTATDGPTVLLLAGLLARLRSRRRA